MGTETDLTKRVEYLEKENRDLLEQISALWDLVQRLAVKIESIDERTESLRNL